MVSTVFVRVVTHFFELTLYCVCVCAVGWVAKPTNPNTADNSVSSKYLKEFLDEMQPDQIREHLR